MKLKGQVAVITGASRGIGFAIARRFAKEGAALAIMARDGAALFATEKELKDLGAKVYSFPGDASNEKQVEKFVIGAMKALGPADIVVNNAGSAISESLLKTDQTLWNKMHAINSTSAFLVTKAFLPKMLERKKGRIVMVASVSGKRGAPYIAAYAASKHSLLGLMRSIAEEFRGKGIVANAVCPGYVDTPMTAKSIENIVQRTGKTEAAAKAILGDMNPQKRLIAPEEVAEKVLELSLPSCTVTGEAIDL